MITRKINKIIYHCSDSPQGRGDTIKEITSWHVNGNGWNDVGYHYVILEDGSIQIGRDLNTSGAHARGHNSDSIGICLIGKDSFTSSQFKALEFLTKGLIKQLKIEHIIGHCDVSSKTCPNFNVQEFKLNHGINI